MLFGVLLSYIAYSSQPSNYTTQIVISLSLGLLAVLALLLKLNTKTPLIATKVMLTVSIVGSLILLFV